MAKPNMSLKKNPMPTQDPKVRARNFEEVALGYSEETAARIDAEVKRLCQECYDMAVKALTDNRDKLDLLTEALLQHETLSRQEFVTLMETGVMPEITSEGKPRSLHEILEESKAEEQAEEKAAEEENAEAKRNILVGSDVE